MDNFDKIINLITFIICGNNGHFPLFYKDITDPFFKNIMVLNAKYFWYINGLFISDINQNNQLLFKLLNHLYIFFYLAGILYYRYLQLWLIGGGGLPLLFLYINPLE